MLSAVSVDSGKLPPSFLPFVLPSSVGPPCPPSCPPAGPSARLPQKTIRHPLCVTYIEDLFCLQKNQMHPQQMHPVSKKLFVVAAALLTAFVGHCAAHQEKGGHTWSQIQGEAGKDPPPNGGAPITGPGTQNSNVIDRTSGLTNAPPRNSSAPHRVPRKQGGNHTVGPGHEHWRPDIKKFRKPNSSYRNPHLPKTNESAPRRNVTEHHCYNERYTFTSHTGNEWRAELNMAARKFSRNNSIVLTGGDWAYRANVLNWIAHAENIGMTEYLVLCYGERMYNLVGSWEEGGHGILVKDCSRVIEYMFMKIMGMSALHDEGYIVTWSDCDALWLKPFMDTWILPYGDRVDIMGQKGLYPSQTSAKAGSVICTGLFTVFPSPRSSRAMDLFLNDLHSSTQASDQYVVNINLGHLGAYNFNGKVVFDDEDMDQVVFIPQYRNTSGPTLGFLPSGVFPRSRSEREWVYVQKHDPALWHSKTPKQGKSKVDRMKSEYVFALKRGWETLVNSSQVSSFIDKDLLRAQKWRNISAIKRARSPVLKRNVNSIEFQRSNASVGSNPVSASVE